MVKLYKNQHQVNYIYCAEASLKESLQKLHLVSFCNPGFNILSNS